MVGIDHPGHQRKMKNTECYVHALLESQRKQGLNNQGLEGIIESFREGQPSYAIHELKGGDELVEPKSHATNEDDDPTPTGQEDQKTWNTRMQEQQVRNEKLMSDGVESQDADENVLHSRLLTKKQLSDMAWGVRELSKRLGNIKLKLQVKTVFLLTKAHDESLIENTRELARWLLSPDRRVRYTVWIEDNLKDNKKFNAQGLLKDLEKEYSQIKDATAEDKKPLPKRLRYWTNELCRTKPHTFDFVVTLGGDGTVLYASWLFQRIVPPVLSFALGSLGFLTKFDYEDFQDTLTKAFRDGVTISLRLRFEGTVMRSQKRKRKQLQNQAGNGESKAEEDGEEEVESNAGRDLVEELIGEEKEDERTHRPDGTYEILNDIVVDRGPNPSKFTETNSNRKVTKFKSSHVRNRNLR